MLKKKHRTVGQGKGDRVTHDKLAFRRGGGGAGLKVSGVSWGMQGHPCTKQVS